MRAYHDFGAFHDGEIDGEFVKRRGQCVAMEGEASGREPGEGELRQRVERETSRRIRQGRTVAPIEGTGHRGISLTKLDDERTAIPERLPRESAAIAPVSSAWGLCPRTSRI